jgi:hypothetical protein
MKRIDHDDGTMTAELTDGEWAAIKRVRKICNEVAFIEQASEESCFREPAKEADEALTKMLTRLPTDEA